MLRTVRIITALGPGSLLSSLWPSKVTIPRHQSELALNFLSSAKMQARMLLCLTFDNNIERPLIFLFFLTILSHVFLLSYMHRTRDVTHTWQSEDKRVDPGGSSLGRQACQQAPLPAGSAHTQESPDTPICKCLVSEYREVVFLSIPANEDEWCACKLSGVTPGAQSCHQCNRKTPGSSSWMPPRNPSTMFRDVFFRLALFFKV